MHLRHTRQTRQILAVDAGKIVGVAGHDLQQVIRRSRHQVAFQHVGNARDLFLERFEYFVGLPRQGNFNKNRRAPVNLARVQKGHIPGDHLRGFQPLHPPVTGRSRQVDPLGKLRIGHASVLLQHGQDSSIRLVNFHLFALFCVFYLIIR